MNYFLDSSIAAFPNAVKSFSTSKEDLQALSPAALTPFSAKDSDAALHMSN